MKNKLFSLLLATSMLFISGCSCAPTGTDTHYDENPEDFDPTTFISRHTEFALEMENNAHRGGRTMDTNYRNYASYVSDELSGGKIKMANGEFQLISNLGEGSRVYSYSEVMEAFGTKDYFEESVNYHDDSVTFTFNYDEENNKITLNYVTKAGDLTLAKDEENGQFYLASNGAIVSYLLTNYGLNTSSYNLLTGEYGPDMIMPFLDFAVKHGTFNKDKLEFHYEKGEEDEPLELESRIVKSLSLILRRENNGEYVPNYFEYIGEEDEDMYGVVNVDIVKIKSFVFKDVTIDTSKIKPIACDHVNKGYKYDSVDETHHRKYCSYCHKYIAEPVAHIHHEGTGFCEKCLYNDELVAFENADLNKLYPEDERHSFFKNASGDIFAKGYFSIYDSHDDAIEKVSDYLHRQFTLLDEEGTVWENTYYVDIYYPEEKILYVFAKKYGQVQLDDACLAKDEYYLAKFKNVELEKDTEASEDEEYDKALTETVAMSLPELNEEFELENKYLFSVMGINHAETHDIVTTEGCVTITQTICDKCDEVTDVRVTYNHDYEYHFLEASELPEWVTPHYESNNVFFQRSCKACGLVEEEIYEFSLSGITTSHDSWSFLVYVHKEGQNATSNYMTIPHEVIDGVCTLCGATVITIGDFRTVSNESASNIHSLIKDTDVGQSVGMGSYFRLTDFVNEKDYSVNTYYPNVEKDESDNKYVTIKFYHYNYSDDSYDYLNLKITDNEGEEQLEFELYHIEEDESEKLLGSEVVSYKE